MSKGKSAINPGLCAVLVVALSGYASTASSEQQIARIQPLPEKPEEAAPVQMDQFDSLIPAEALKAYGIDPIITGPVPKARRS